MGGAHALSEPDKPSGLRLPSFFSFEQVRRKARLYLVSIMADPNWLAQPQEPDLPLSRVTPVKLFRGHRALIQPDTRVPYVIPMLDLYAWSLCMR